MRIIVLVAMVYITGAAWAGNEGGSPAPSKPTPAMRQGILDACVTTGGNILTVLEERDNTTHYRLMLLDKTGKVLSDNRIEPGSGLGTNHTLIPWKNGHGLGWSEPGIGVVVATLQDGIVKTETVISDNSKEDGAIGAFCILNVDGQQKLLLVRHRYIQVEGQLNRVGRQYSWVYCYGLGKETPELIGKACVENDQVRSNALICASEGPNILVWEAVHEKDNPVKGTLVQTVRVAKWVNGGELDWKERFIGNDPLRLEVDYSHGGVCFVQEWKSPEDGSGIAYGIRKDSTAVLPVGSYGGFCGVAQFRYDSIHKSWLFAQKCANGIKVRLLGEDLADVRSEVIPGKDITDFTLVTDGERSYVLLLRNGKLTVKDIGDTSCVNKQVGRAWPAASSTRP